MGNTTKLSWKSREFKNLYEITDGNQIVGEMKHSTWHNRAEYKTKEQTFILKAEGISGRKITLYEGNESNPVGLISYNTWQTKADIKINENLFKLEYTNGLANRMVISNESEYVKFRAKTGKGEISGDTENTLLIACGLFNHNKNNIAIFSVLFVIFIAVIYKKCRMYFRHFI